MNLVRYATRSSASISKRTVCGFVASLLSVLAIGYVSSSLIEQESVAFQSPDLEEMLTPCAYPPKFVFKSRGPQAAPIGIGKVHPFLISAAILLSAALVFLSFTEEDAFEVPPIAIGASPAKTRVKKHEANQISMVSPLTSDSQL